MPQLAKKDTVRSSRRSRPLDLSAAPEHFLIRDRLQTVALRGVSALIWPETDSMMTAAERNEAARRLVDDGDPRASQYYRTLLAVASEAARRELEDTTEAHRG